MCWNAASQPPNTPHPMVPVGNLLVGLTSHNANRATLLEAPTITLTQLPDG
jgi:hypothetical protein